MTTTVLFCLPYSGGTARVFEPLAALAPGNIEIRAVEPPGRGARLREPLITDYDTLVGSMASYLIADFQRQPTGAAVRRYAILGHCAGGVLGVAVAKTMTAALGQPPMQCFLAAAAAPHLASVGGLGAAPSDEELLATFASYGLTPPEVLAEPAFAQHIVPILRTDFGIVSQYHQASTLRVDYPLTLIAASRDSIVPADSVWAWSQYTSAPCRQVLIDGDHFSILSSPRELLDAVSADLAIEDLVI